ncbi:MAG: SPOR domain-containing protein [Rhodobacteraceae bacterium]|nr:SPOR domain-containing protein [Paracoccaceae bacterium]
MTFSKRGFAQTAALCLAALILAGCDDMPAQLDFLQPRDRDETDAAPQNATATRLIERDVEAPEVFQVAEAGLWDGRPSLGGVWVAHPDVTDPERVIIRNMANGKFVIGALFRREREIPGPRLQVSSDAANALSMIAGAPVQLQVTALRREEVAEEPAAPEPFQEAAEITDEPLDPIASAAAAGLATPPAATPPASAPAAAPAPEPEPASRPRASSLAKPYIQIGIFSVEANADRTAQQMRAAGMLPTVRKQSANGKTFWRVIVGPAQSSSERASLLARIKEIGFSDAYAVTN